MEAAREVAEAEKPAPFRPSLQGWAARGAVAAVIAWVVLCYPGNILSPFKVSTSEADAVAEAAIFAVIGLSLNVLIGYTGTISLGHQAFVGFGAFASAYVVTEMGQEFWIALPAAAAVGAIQAALLGGISLRLSGLYFALVTLSYGVMAEESLFKIEKFTGGDAGKAAPRPIGFDSNYRYYYLCLAFLALVLWLDWRMMKTKGGRALLALRENPRVAATVGINVKGYTVLAFAVAGAFAGIGGSLLAHHDLTVVRAPFTFQLSLVFIMMTVVGGLRSRSGIVIAAASVALLSSGELLELLHLEGFFKNTINLPTEFVPLIILPLLTLLTLLTLTLYPGGIGQQIAPIREWLRGRRFDRHAGAVKEVQITDVRA
jgi:branched-chain amino acid transport system permease protein